MRIPTREELDEVCELIGGEGADFDRLSPEQRLEVVRLAIAADIAHSLDSICGDTEKIGQWFKASRVYDGFN